MPPLGDLGPITPERIRDLQNLFFDKAHNHSRLVLGLGYGGFFAMWSSTKSLISAHSVLLSGLLMMVSALFFVVFSVAEAWLFSHQGVQLAKATASRSGPERIQAVQAFLQRLDTTQGRLIRFWYPIFAISAVTGAAGALILIAAFVRSLLK